MIRHEKKGRHRRPDVERVARNKNGSKWNASRWNKNGATWPCFAPCQKTSSGGKCACCAGMLR
ncbi:MAG: hypothetical protein D6800_11605 [Candidatus Zixiibacteriota bacterium]|nr:MAG: hypothetical protein D6800_11605 [candidate division Zixibacteria bacterium]